MQVPSKTFLLGEYLAMQGGPAIMALTSPCFSLNSKQRLHPDCMAARFWRDYQGRDCDWGLTDPYHGKGGLGASSAEFVLAYKQIFPQSQQNPAHLREIFFKYVDENAKQKPSGYDVMAQMHQGLLCIQENHIEPLTWSFEQLGFVLVHTGQKLKTHEHLFTGQWTLDVEQLSQNVQKATHALKIQNDDLFVQSICDFHQALCESHLVATHSLDLLNQLRMNLPILASKGCGAMGADVMLLVMKIQNMPTVIRYLQQEKLDILATHQQLYFETA
jgi:mevalonate kinase